MVVPLLWCVMDLQDLELMLLFVDTWKDHVENIKNNGLRVIIDDKELGYYNIPTYYPEDAQGKYDVVFVATKSMQLRSMLTKVKHLMHENTKSYVYWMD